MRKILAIESLSVSFQPVPGTVLQDVSFSLDQGSRTALVGPSGCGKTTLVRAIGGSLDATISGSVRWDPAIAIPVPIVWQDVRLFPWMTVLQNVEYVLRLRNSGEPHGPSAANLLDAVGMSWAAGLWPSRISRGQAQRVALARCLATGSEVLLLDEPFASLDAITRRKMGAFLLDLALSRGLTYLLVTHEAREAIELTDRILVLTDRPARIAAEFVRTAGRFEENVENRIWERLSSG